MISDDWHLESDWVPEFVNSPQTIQPRKEKAAYIHLKPSQLRQRFFFGDKNSNPLDNLRSHSTVQRAQGLWLFPVGSDFCDSVFGVVAGVSTTFAGTPASPLSLELEVYFNTPRSRCTLLVLPSRGLVSQARVQVCIVLNTRYWISYDHLCYINFNILLMTPAAAANMNGTSLAAIVYNVNE